MKKIVLAMLTIAASTTLFIACQKDKVTSSPTKQKQDISLISMPIIIDSTPGGMHNYYFIAIDSLYGGVPIDTSSTTPLTISDIGTIATQIGSIADSFNEAAPPIDSFVAKVIRWFVSDGYLVSGNLISINARAAKILNGISNSSIKTVFTNINNYSGSKSGFLPYANAQIATLQNLTATEAEMVGGYSSVLNHSYVLWDAKQEMTTTQKAKIIASQDALGWWEGYKKASNNPLGSILGEASKVACADISAALFSYAAAKRLGVIN